ncbi:MAG: hypothetical protein AUG13_05100 [Chloroflexi bacterium 13_1_20CM_2_59_7]|nr:MAG: hypothetical protein AUG13_05100 [Chloroflexi bacterium 13_1_20CM_2_59_7]
MWLGVRVKEPFLLIFSLLWIAGAVLPKKLYRKSSGKPFERQLLARIGFLAIGLSLLLLWYSLRSN